MKKFISFGIILGLSACGASPEGDPGQCPLKCSNAKIGDALKMKVTPINVPDSYSCIGAGGVPFERPVVLTFRVTNTVSSAPYDGKSSEVDLPVGGLSFLAQTSGGVFYAPGTSTDNGSLVDDKWQPPEYTGIATPKKEWCTDACGVLTIQVWPSCPPAGTKINGTVNVRSGSLAPSVPVNVVVETVVPSLTDDVLPIYFEAPADVSRQL